ncbi:MAG: PEP-CTERM sorting domain-containing protein [Burkholderiaceae bacterium]
MLKPPLRLLCMLLLSALAPVSQAAFVAYEIGAGYIAPRAVNAAGQVAGDMTGLPGQFSAFLWSPGEGLVSLGPDASAYAINGSGQVTGTFYSGHVFLSTGGGPMVDLGNLGGPFAWAMAINDSGQVTGYSDTTSWGISHAFLSTNGGAMQDLGTLPGGSSSRGNAINNSGQVTGCSEAAGGGVYAFISSNGGAMQNLGALGGIASCGTAINESGQVTGDAEIPSGSQHAFIWSSGTSMLDLGTLGGDTSYGDAINNSGQVAGLSWTAGNTAYHAFLYTLGIGMQDLGTLGGGSSRASAIDGMGRVFGESETATGEWDYFLYDGGVMSNLDPVVAGLGIVDIFGAYMGRSGNITGWGYDAAGGQIAFLLMQTEQGGGSVPEPPTLALLGLALATGAIGRRRAKPA